MASVRLPRPAGPEHGGRATVVAVLATVLGVLPVFLLGSAAVLVRSELDFDEAALGLSLSCFYATTALCSVPGGRIADRLGARRALVIANSASACTLASIGLLVNSWASLTAALVLGGAANGLAQPASNLALADGVRRSRMGTAFGLKQSAIPIAGLTAGLALPAIALPLGWRWAFVGAGLVGVTGALMVPAGVPSRARRRPALKEDAPAGPLFILAAGCAFGSAAGLALAAFLVQSSIESGHSPELSGLILAVGGAVGVLSRLGSGWLADRREGRHLLVVAWMLGSGAVGFGLIAMSEGSIAMLGAGTALCFGLAWGWPGLFFLAIVRWHPRAPGRATGTGQAGAAVGGVMGPLAFGVIVSAVSYPVAWCVAGLSVLVSAALMLLGRRALIAGRGVSGTALVSIATTPGQFR